MPTRRRRKVTWLPTIGTVIGEGLGTSNGQNFVLAVPDNGTIITHVRPLTWDNPPDLDTTDTLISTMSDIIGSEYMLHRIVGKLFACRLPGNVEGDDEGPPVLFGAGFFVARASDQNPAQPIGAAAEFSQDYSPLEVDTVREPWIWRRTWILGAAGKYNPGAGFASENVENPLTTFWPASTALYGSVLDGPHVDAKTRRRVSNDERLWFAYSACQWPVGNVQQASITYVEGYLDYRLVGNIMRARNRGVF